MGATNGAARAFDKRGVGICILEEDGASHGEGGELETKDLKKVKNDVEV